MKSHTRWFVPVLVALVAVVLTTSALLGVEPEAGKAVYDKKCASCHGKTGEGNPAIAKALKVELRHLDSKEVQAQSDAEWRKVITEGTAKKKPVKGLTEEDLTLVLAYLRTLKP